MSSRRWAWWSLFVVGCAADGKDTTTGASSGGDSTDSADTGPIDDDTAPCSAAQVCWDALEAEGLTGATFVCPASDGGSSSGDGTRDAPFDSMSAALLAGSGGTATIALGPGTYLENVALSDTEWTDVTLRGCGADESTGTVWSPLDPTIPSLEAKGTAVDLSAVVLSGGQAPLTIWDGAQVLATELEVVDADNEAIVIDGSSSGLTLSSAAIRGVSTVGLADGGRGFGIVVHNGTASITDTVVEEASVVGVLVSGSYANVSLDSVEVRDTAVDPVDGTYGRGVMAQDGAILTIRESLLENNADAAIFGLGAAYVGVDSVQIPSQLEGVLSGDDATPTGEGVVVSRGDAVGDPSFFLAEVEQTEVIDAPRVGILFADVTVTTLAGNTTTCDDSTECIQAQGATDLSAAGVLDDVETRTVALDLNTEALVPVLTASLE